MNDGFRRRAIMSAILLVMAGCAGEKTQPTIPLEFIVEGDGGMNINEAGEPSPIVLRVYELKSKTAIEQTEFFDLLDKDTEKLGTELLGKREVELKPADTVEFKREAPAETRFLGVIAGFREISKSNWRVVVPIIPERTNVISIKVNALALSVTAKTVRSGVLF